MEHSCPSCAMSDSLPTQLEMAGWVEGSVQEERRVFVPGVYPKGQKGGRLLSSLEVLQSHAQHFTP